MFVIIGIVVVIGAVIAGYLMEHGNLKVLVQPAELVIIGGVVGAFGGSKYNKDKYLETLKMVYELFSRARKEGLMSLEADSLQLPEISQGSSRPALCLRHHSHGRGRRRRAL